MIRRSDNTTIQAGKDKAAVDEGRHYICHTRDGFYVHAHVHPDRSMKVRLLGASLGADRVVSAAERYDIDLKTSIFEIPYHLSQTRALRNESALLVRDGTTPGIKRDTPGSRRR